MNLQFLKQIAGSVLGPIFVKRDETGMKSGFKSVPILVIGLVIGFGILAMSVNDDQMVVNAFDTIVTAIISILAPAGVALYNSHLNRKRTKKNTQLRDKFNNKNNKRRK